MTLFYLVMSVHFLLGSLGVFLHNKKLIPGDQRKNWLKFFWYLIIFSAVTVSIIGGRYTFLSLSVLIFSFSSIEILSASKTPESKVPGSHGKFTFFVLSLLTVLMFFYSVFFFLPWRTILFAYAIVIVFDGASQIAGHLSGRHLIMPAIIPGKTWEGFLGGFAIALITSCILNDMINVSRWLALVAGIIICVSSFAGDLGASAVKRKYGVKDFGNILPGQGGFLDRFDSFIAAGSVIGLARLFFNFADLNIEIDIVFYLLFSIIFIIILFAGDFLYFVYKVKAEYSRAFTHFAAGISCLFFYHAFDSPCFVIAICIQSILFTLLTDRFGVFRSHHGVGRKTLGSPLFFSGVLCSFLAAVYFQDKYLFYLPVLILAVSDPLAAVAGMKFTTRKLPSVFTLKNSGKTFAGSAVFFISSTLLLLTVLLFFIGMPLHFGILISLFVALIATTVEAISIYGIDNLSVPVASMLLLLWLL